MKYKGVTLFRDLHLVMKKYSNGKKKFIVYYNNVMVEGKRFRDGYIFRVPNSYPLYIPLFELRRVFKKI